MASSTQSSRTKPPAAAAADTWAAERRTGSRREEVAAAPPPPPCPVKTLAQFGQLAKDVLYGNRSEGMHGTAGSSKFVVSSATSTGITLSTTATSAVASSSAAPSSPLSGQALVGYSSGDGCWLGDLLLASSGTAEATLSRAFILPTRESNGRGGEEGSLQRQQQQQQQTSPTAPPAKPRSPGKVVIGGVVPLPGLGEPSKQPPPKLQLTLDYAGTYLHAKTSATVAYRPLLTAAVVAGTGQVALGGEAAFSSSTRGLTRWSAAAAWHDDRQQLGLQLGAGGNHSHPAVRLQPEARAGAGAGGGDGRGAGDGGTAGDARTAGRGGGWEGGGGAGGSVQPVVAAKAVEPPPTFSLGISFRLPQPDKGPDGEQPPQQQQPGGGSGVVKAKVSSKGLVSLMYRDTLSAGPRVTLTAELDGLDPSKGPKLGMALEV